jgi:uncharacterized protein (UPF0335 family)
MKPLTLPIIGGTSLVAMAALALGHWLSVNQLVAASKSGLLNPQRLVESVEAPVPAVKPAPKPAVLTQSPDLAQSNRPSTQTSVDNVQRQFYEAMLKRMERMENSNRDLTDQVAQTNGDVMKLGFRVDTHSESFRPLKVAEEESQDLSSDDGPGVLPPRAEPVPLPRRE